ncbi:MULTISPECIES: cob(I)yrinic acid a,c-diamide adenosyltransferase [Bacillus]|uniref:Corrinoid adenosyltransferase n=1 Tax=Bacillus pseudomycoides TaxID=64104 RepID=A0A1Y3MDM4_9BACI|nr:MULTISPECIES: cob(I)yrinic acid a,c-diamide adenosyltransferase [Bacillus cereus group]EOP56811.1 ATP:cob(I)alamin adenosyltransferase [Bacillus cereus VD136]EOP74795.1 ATP:cob(I)alamin adenosyltransferase [Bacillus cereus VDM006]MDF2084049.1 cob(I)yrinic acid a,c-diamide adenosyltransferase [Bacillus pseudomycoides]OUM48176.1 ATP--cob(I)alamin adenosyltransferase [Bacillus pseudomycoides]
MKLYTKTGDKGQTSIIGGRVDKDHIRVEAYGTIDEANSHIGYAMTMLQEECFQDIHEELEKIQHELFDCGGDLAIVQQKLPYKVTEEMVIYLEGRIDHYIEEAPPLECFILPGGSPASAVIHVTRTVTRRAERNIVSLGKQEEINEVVLRYVNRLSDYLFAIARVINARLMVKDVEYKRSAIVFRKKEVE